jgi:hypothetical protein
MMWAGAPNWLDTGIAKLNLLALHTERQVSQVVPDVFAS